MSIIVVGSGIAGLTAAYHLQQAGHSVRVLEAEAIIGEPMSCRRAEGLTFNRAATLLAGGYRFLVDLIKELLDYVVDPAMAAMLATTAARPSVVDFLFSIAHYIGTGAYSYDGESIF